MTSVDIDSCDEAKKKVKKLKSISKIRNEKNSEKVLVGFVIFDHGQRADLYRKLPLRCRSMVWYAGYALDSLPAESRLYACHCKAHLAEVGRFVARTATEVHGGMGFTDLLGLHYWFKRIGANRQLLGAPEFLRDEAAGLQGLAPAAIAPIMS